MVITNNYFTPGAVTLARSNDCTLVDRDLLAQWVLRFQTRK
jgi:HJR/Mrr/RecB family endonuclease